MPALVELSGRRFGQLLVNGDGGRDARGAVLWRCACDCGRTTLVRGSSLTQGRTRSCGCGVAAKARQPRLHGQSKGVLYRRWQAMKRRCLLESDSEYRNYGGRGISVCARWRTSFVNFTADMAPTFFDGGELDRIDTNGHYEPANCRWVRRQQQQRNKRSNHVLTINGVSKTVIEWAEETGLKANTIVTRIRRGWPTGRLLELANAPSDGEGR